MADTSKKIILWSRKGCEACQNLKAAFAEQQIDYQNVDVEGKDYLRDILELKYGIRHVPVVEIGRGITYEAVTDGDLSKIQEIVHKELQAPL